MVAIVVVSTVIVIVKKKRGTGRVSRDGRREYSWATGREEGRKRA